MLHGEKSGCDLLVLIPQNCYVRELCAGGELRVQKGFHLGVHHVPNENVVSAVVADVQISAHCRLQILGEFWQADNPKVAPIGIKEMSVNS